jgi:hypothetical protein
MFQPLIDFFAGRLWGRIAGKDLSFLFPGTFTIFLPWNSGACFRPAQRLHRLFAARFPAGMGYSYPNEALSG